VFNKNPSSGKAASSYILSEGWHLIKISIATDTSIVLLNSELG
jgi:hypothetical protein